MKDAYVNIFYDIVKETKETSGFSLPDDTEAYVVMLLANYLDKADFLPEKSFAEAYLKLKKPRDHNAKELGDACLFVSGVFPLYGRKYGLNQRYYQDIGISSYEIVAEVLNYNLFKQLALNFIYVSDFIEMSVHNKKISYIL